MHAMKMKMPDVHQRLVQTVPVCAVLYCPGQQWEWGNAAHAVCMLHADKMVSCNCGSGECTNCTCARANALCTANCHGHNFNPNCTNTTFPLRQCRRAVKWWRRNATVIAMVTAVLAILGSMETVQNAYDRYVCDEACQIDKELTDNLWASGVSLPIEAKEVVHRQALNNTLMTYVTQSMQESRQYVVVVGPRGCGKSTAVIDALQGVPGVVLVSLGTDSDVFGEIFNELGLRRGTKTTNPSLRTLVDVTKSCQQTYQAGNTDWQPTIVAEIDRGAADGVVLEVSKKLKRLSSDMLAAHVILVLSDANAAFALPPDPDRQEVVWVEDFTEEEAHAYLDKRKFLVPVNKSDEADPNNKLRAHLFHSIGTRPVALNAAIGKGEAGLEKFIAHRLLEADEEVLGLVGPRTQEPELGGDRFERLVRMLLKTTDDVGVSMRATNEFLAAPSEAAEILKKKCCYAILYHHPTKTYRFYSPAHRRAAEVWAKMHPEQ